MDDTGRLFISDQQQLVMLLIKDFGWSRPNAEEFAFYPGPFAINSREAKSYRLHFLETHPSLAIKPRKVGNRIQALQQQMKEAERRSEEKHQRAARKALKAKGLG